jgi:cytidine deaminase
VPSVHWNPVGADYTGEHLIEQARLAAQRSHAPYSRFPVGAVVQDASRRTYVGCNVESASYGLTLCAERVAIFSAIAAGAERPFTALAVCCSPSSKSVATSARMPCGACRQVIAEHLAPDAPIYVDGAGTFRIADLLPDAFRLAPGEPSNRRPERAT